MNNSYITIIKEKRTVLSRKRIPLNQNECTADFRIGVPFEQNLQNYGYSIILSAFTREITANGYITQLGIFHDNMFNQFNLASDLMEPFRALVDREVLNMKLGKFEHDEKMQLVNVLNQEVQIDGKIQYVNNAVKIYCKSIFDALNEDDCSLIRFYKIEL